MRKSAKKILFLSTLFFIAITFSKNTYAKANYTIGSSEIQKVCKENYRTIQNKNTRASLGINFFIEKIRKSGGGTLTIKKGTYLISNSIYLPSNIKVVLKSGVTLKKISKTGVYYPASSSMWQFVSQSKSKKKNAVGKYNGSKNVKVEGRGKVVIDMNYTTGHGMILAHDSNVSISGIQFKHMNGNHYIEVNSSKNVTIKKCKFEKSKQSNQGKYYNKEAINIDTPDASTYGLPVPWVKQDKTGCKNVTIEKCTFDGMGRAIGTHKYSQKGKGNNVYHTGITIKNNVIKNIYDNGIYILNWKDTVITGNTFTNIGLKGSGTYSSDNHGISGGGIKGISITKNSFTNIKGSIGYFCPKVNNGDKSDYTPIKVYITKKEATAMLDNKKSNCGKEGIAGYSGCDFVCFTVSETGDESSVLGVDINNKKVV